jgi:hypothetical protein
MTERRGDTLLFHTPPVIAAQAAVGGKKESDGPLAAGFDELTTDNRLGQCSWEAAEKQLQLRAARLCLQKAALPAERVDLALAGDLQAQCTASGYALRELGVPFAGLVVEAASGKAQDVVTALESYKQDQVAFYGNYAEFAQAQSNVENAIISSKGDRVVMVIASNECTADLNSAVDSALNS